MHNTGQGEKGTGRNRNRIKTIPPVGIYILSHKNKPGTRANTSPRISPGYLYRYSNRNKRGDTAKELYSEHGRG